MNNGREVVIISGVRTAIGDFGGALKDFAPTDLGARCVREALSRAKVAPEEVGHVVFGGVIHTETKDMYLSRVCAINGGIPKEVPATRESPPFADTRSVVAWCVESFVPRIFTNSSIVSFVDTFVSELKNHFHLRRQRRRNCWVTHWL